jgi:hypothetical protein
MSPQELVDLFDSYLEVSRAGIAISGLWSFLLGKIDEDDETIEAHDFVLDVLSDADATRIIQAKTGRDLRELTVEEALEMHDDINARAWGWKWN